MMSDFDYPMCIMSSSGNGSKVHIIVIAEIAKDVSGEFPSQIPNQNTGGAVHAEPGFQKTGVVDSAERFERTDPALNREKASVK